MEKKYLKLEDITAYKIASELSDYIWQIVSSGTGLINEH